MTEIPETVADRRELVRSRFQQATDRRDAMARAAVQAEIEYERAKESLDVVDFIINAFTHPERSS